MLKRTQAKTLELLKTRQYLVNIQRKTEIIVLSELMV